ncbi:protein-disulfide isomerase [Leucobacter exalbidus]|uniref:Protein-disulfide isomerase n=1 Tax=Leucobacter exalbidus TaxID=662960 RepID=A0A940T572_9MICO|nr:thioredoxin domain-containing protein [Leucobacter exalbidus]MBP1325696.1 protein-disulfide isomerase [Leucobacter exalbidus]
MSDPAAPGQGDQTPATSPYEPAPVPDAAAPAPAVDPAQLPAAESTPAASFAPAPAAAPVRALPHPSRGIAIAAMAVGLASIVTALVAMLYAPVALILSAGLAIAAIVLGGISIARRAPRAPGITGLVAGLATLALTACVVMFDLGMIGVQAFKEATASSGFGAPNETGEGHGAPEAPGTPGAPGHPDVPEAPEAPGASDGVSWPANFASGGIMFTGDSKSSLRVIESDALPDNSFPNTAALADRADGTSPDRIQLYLDYRCPACLIFEEANGDTLEEAALAGAVVELQPLTFLDQASAGSYYSSRVAGAMACVAEREPDLAWTAHRALLHPDFQPAEGIKGPDNAALVERIEGATGGLQRDTRSCIAHEQHVTFAQALSNWHSTNPVPRAANPELRVTGTPLVVVNGVAYPGSIDDADEFMKFLTQQGVDLP